MINKKPELLSPAGSYEAFQAALSNGCDAVYLGGQHYGARASAQNFDREGIVKAIDEAHLLGRRVYVTTNTLIKENEMQDFLEEAEFLYKEGADALILQDLGAFDVLRRRFPDLPLHASTQMTVHSAAATQACLEMGFERVVLSRELSLAEIARIKEETGAELECFVHGALCYCYSGQCLMSSVIGGRSGNRGACAQPCRLPYRSPGSRQEKDAEGYLLSPKDIQTLTILPQLIESGIDSFKIEGRMKNPTYVGLMTALYRHYIDVYFENPQDYRVDQADILKMQQIFSRGGFSDGYYLTRNGREMMSLDNPKHQGVPIGRIVRNKKTNALEVALEKPVAQGDCLEIDTKSERISFTATQNGMDFLKLPPHLKGISPSDPVHRLTDVGLAKAISDETTANSRKCPITGTFTARVGETAALVVKMGSRESRVTGSVTAPAVTRPMGDEQIRQQLMKTGNDPVVFEKLDIFIEGDIFIPVKELNAMRREAIDGLLAAIIGSYKRKPEMDSTEAGMPEEGSRRGAVPGSAVEVTVLISNTDYLPLLENRFFDAVYADMASMTDAELERCLQSRLAPKIYFALPRIIRDEQKPIMEKRMKLLRDRRYGGILIRTLDGQAWVPKGKPFRMDFTANIMNRQAAAFWAGRGAEMAALSPELNLKELGRFRGMNQPTLELTVYGYLPLMVSSQCVTKTKTGMCPKDFKDVLLTDRKNMTFRVSKDCRMCANTIYNAVPTVLLDKWESLVRCGIGALRLELTTESPELAEGILNLGDQIKAGQAVSNQQIEALLGAQSYTRGHYNRGVQ